MAGWQKILTDSNSATLTNKTHTSPVLNTGVSGTAILDEDAMGTDSNTQLATQQSIKAYVDGQTHLSLIDEDNMSTDSATRPPSQQSVKAYVDGQDHAGNIDGLTDTNIGTEAAGEVLIYNLTTTKWVDAALTGTANEVDVTLGDGTCQIGLPQDVTISQNLTVTGNLDVNGTTTSINTTNLEVSDAVMILRTGEAGVYAGGKADVAITFLGTNTTPVVNEIGKLVWDYTGKNIYGGSNTAIGTFRMGLTASISDFAAQNNANVGSMMPALNCGGIMLDNTSGAAYHTTDTPIAAQDGLMVWDGTDLYIYDS